MLFGAPKRNDPELRANPNRGSGRGSSLRSRLNIFRFNSLNRIGQKARIGSDLTFLPRPPHPLMNEVGVQRELLCDSGHGDLRLLTTFDNHRFKGGIVSAALTGLNGLDRKVCHLGAHL